ncbi:sigma-E processing peptidase SpoIIGA [Metabacillus fastidiosus]|uniref:Sporulation sigma-E factor-processing peptidase n=1 Tax=Metabacillus fastidiosus TaxID=1458 RepID=A0ABU6NX18_9BACI|nr:sigma-E processing peptidase SpoIIGA [Metabacillus fastidiosus]MED4401659.1 sigma-E processing peptidase SpoIIGA [Metabacillus fastidiosus]MED4463298.1 sigma-E processing peptidase SpoIIGA [Metabacillus fastidiosus]
MSIYLDVIWFLNFSFDLFLLLLTAIILKRKIKKLRLLLGALIGSGIVILMFTPFSFIAVHPLGKLAISVLMVLISFGFQRFRSFFQSLLTFYFVTFMIGGGMLGTHYFMQVEMGVLDGVMMTSSTGFGDPISWLFVLIGFPLAWYFSRNRLESLETKKIKFDQLVQVLIKVDSNELLLRGLIDSGNQLYDPISRSPVMIIDASKAKSFLPEKLFEQALKDDVMASVSQDSEEGHEWEHRVRLIPYRVVGHENQFLLGFKPDEISIQTKEGTIHVKKAVIGLNRTTLSSDDEYDCIIHPKMMQGIQNVS